MDPLSSSSVFTGASPSPGASLLCSSLIENRLRLTLAAISKWISDEGHFRPQCFISYAWTPSEQKAQELGVPLTEKDYSLQSWLRKVQGDLAIAGITAQLDLTHLEAGNHIGTYMRDGIEKADFGLVIGTPFLKIRGQDASTNVAFELAEMEKKRKTNPASVIGLLRVGQFSTSFPSGYLDYLLEDFSSDDNYFTSLLKLVGTLYGMTQNAFFKDHVHLFEEQVRQAHQKIWNVGINHKTFVARETELEYLSTHCHPPSDPSGGRKVFVVTGGAGTGKSQLARKFANHHSQRFQFGWWIDSETETSLLAALADLATTLALFPTDDQSPKDIAEKLIKLLASKAELGRWLLVFDNVEEEQADTIFQKYIPAKGGLVILTSRNTMKRQLIEEEAASLGQEGNTLKLSPFGLEDSCSLFEKITRKPKDESVKKIAEMLGCLPLAINHAATFIRENDCPPEEFLAMLQAQEGLVVQDQEDFRAVSSTFLLSIEHLRKTRPSTLPFLQKIAFLAPDDIPVVIFSPPERDRLTLDERKTLAVLENYSIVTLNEKGDRFCLHRLMQSTVRAHCLPSKFQECWEQKDCVVALLLKLGAMTKEKDQSSADINRRRDLIPHIEALLHHAEGLGLGSIAQVAPLLLNYSITEFRLGNAQKRKALSLKALAIQQKATGLDSKAVVPILSQVGASLIKLGDPKQGREVLLEALAIHGKKGKEVDDAEAAEILTNLGIACGEVGEQDKKRDYLERALEIQERVLGKEHFQVSKTLANLGMAYGSLGQIDKQKVALERALEIKERHYGPHHYEVGKTLTNLASVYGATGDVLRQKELLERSLVIKEQHYGKDHASVSTTLLHLGMACSDLGDFESERAHLERCLAIREASFGKENFQVAAVYSAMAKGMLQRKDHEKSKALSLKALGIQMKHYGKDTEEVAKTLSTLGLALMALEPGSLEGEDYLRRALVAFREAYQDDTHPTVTFCQNVLAERNRQRLQSLDWVKIEPPANPPHQTKEDDDHFGSWMLKFGGTFLRRQFQWRYFTFSKKEGVLKWVLNPGGSIRNSLNKNDIDTLREVSKKEVGREFCFALEGVRLRRTYILVASDRESYNKWISLLTPTPTSK